MIHSDDESTEIVEGTKVLHKGLFPPGIVLGFHTFPSGPPMAYVEFPNGTRILADLADLQNIDDKREG